MNRKNLGEGETVQRACTCGVRPGGFIDGIAIDSIADHGVANSCMGRCLNSTATILAILPQVLLYGVPNFTGVFELFI